MSERKARAKKRVVKPRELGIDTMKKLLIAIAEAYPTDPSTPGIVLSALKNGNIYGAILRYHSKWGEGKQVVFTRQGASIGEVLRGLAEELLAHQDAFVSLRQSL